MKNKILLNGILIMLLISLFLISCAPIDEDINPIADIVSDEELDDLINEADLLTELEEDIDASEDLDLDLGLE